MSLLLPQQQLPAECPLPIEPLCPLTRDRTETALQFLGINRREPLGPQKSRGIFFEDTEPLLLSRFVTSVGSGDPSFLIAGGTAIKKHRPGQVVLYANRYLVLFLNTA